MGIGKQLREIRLMRGLSRRDLAEKLGVTVSTISNYENEVSHPKEEIMLKMFRELEIEPNELFKDAFLLDEFGDPDYEMPNNGLRGLPIEPTTLAAHRPDGYDKDLPEEALKELDSFLDYLRVKYKKD